jgi:hypothetical protein
MFKLLSLFRRPDYQSDATQFIDKLKVQKPQLQAQQLAGRALLWDKNPDRSAQAEWDQAQLAQKAYPYQTDPRPSEAN